jgi:hypothetical protein
MQKGAMPAPLPDWSYVEDDDLREWLQGLDTDDQDRLAGQHVDKLDRARGDALMGEGIALRPLRVPFPQGWDGMTDEEQNAWWNGPFKIAAGKLIEADQAARRAAEEVEP